MGLRSYGKPAWYLAVIAWHEWKHITAAQGGALPGDPDAADPDVTGDPVCGGCHHAEMSVEDCDRFTSLACEELLPWQVADACDAWWEAYSSGIDLSLFVQFYDSRDVYRIDLDSADHTTATKVATPLSDPNYLTIPELSNNYDVRWSADRPQFGFVYIMASDPLSVLQDDVLVLQDLNKDGSLDGSLVMDLQTWNAQAWGDLTSYATVYR
jgi:hypothetical protein